MEPSSRFFLAQRRSARDPGNGFPVGKDTEVTSIRKGHGQSRFTVECFHFFNQRQKSRISVQIRAIDPTPGKIRYGNRRNHCLGSDLERQGWNVARDQCNSMLLQKSELTLD